MLNNLEKIKADACTERAYRQILSLLMSEEIRQADIISHRSLAAHLGMSKQPVGAALRRLEQEGLVEAIPRVGTRVCRISAQDMWDMLQWRVALECQCARLANQWMTDSQREQLLAAAVRLPPTTLRQHTDPLNPANVEADVNFHLLVAKFSGCHRLHAELKRIDIFHLKMFLCDAVAIVQMLVPQPVPVTHEQLAQTLISGIPDEAETCMRKHLQSSWQISGFIRWYMSQHHSKTTMA